MQDAWTITYFDTEADQLGKETVLTEKGFPGAAAIAIARHGFEVVAVEHASPADRLKARETARHDAQIALGKRVAEMLQARDDRDRELEDKLNEALMDEYLASDANGRMQPGQWMDQAYFAFEEWQTAQVPV